MLYQLSYTRNQENNDGPPYLFYTEACYPPYYMVGVVGFEPTQLKAPDLQSGPALPLRRTPLFQGTKRIIYEPAEGLEPPTS
jgi:hypothetical protein